MARRKLINWRGIARTEFGLVALFLAAVVFAVMNWGGVTGDDWSLPPPGQGKGGDVAGDKAPRVDHNLPKPGTPVRFVSYNVRNYFVEGEGSRNGYKVTHKPESSRQAVALEISRLKPDIVGLCELGGPLALEDLQTRLAGQSLNLKHAVILTRRGEDRALALLSRHPVTSNHSVRDAEIGDRGDTMLRGILDVTVGLPDGRKFRLVGVHLKSHKDTDGLAENRRRMEARALRRHLSRTEDGLPLLVFGDFNDGPDSQVMAIVSGAKRRADGLGRLIPKDSRNETWTIHYQQGEAYFSYDHLLLNRILRSRLGRRAHCGIADYRHDRTASDHRPLWVDLK